MSSVYSCLVLLISYLLKRRLVRWFVGCYFVYDTQGVFYGEGGVTAWSDFFIAILFISAKKRIILTSRRHRKLCLVRASKRDRTRRFHCRWC